ncbi:MAG: Crp/Fnr family transcriptional regulator, partial [Spirochaetaceae bacterium]|nr:Crp/Fnr family transcriptional regulator [Spirochaetaceae bacterium]
MRNYGGLLSQCRLFDGIKASDLGKLLNCLPAVQKTHKKGVFISMAGGNFNSAGVVLSGGIHIVQDDFWGNRTLVARFEPVEIFGEAFVFGEKGSQPVGILAAEQSDVLWINCEKLITT